MKQVSKRLGTLLWLLVALALFVQISPAVAAQSYMLVAPERIAGWYNISLPVLRFEFTGTGPLTPLTDIPANLVYNAMGPAFSRQGELFVSNSYGNVGPGSISRFIIDSNRNFIPNGLITGNSLTAAQGITFSAGGELFAANYVNSTISRFLFDDTGVAIPNGVIITDALNQGVAFSSSGELFTTHDSSVIRRFLFDSSNGNAIPNGSFTVPGAVGLAGLAFSSKGELFVADARTDNVFRILFDTAGNPVMKGAISGIGGPVGVAFSGEDELFVTSWRVAGISRFLFDTNGNVVANGVVLTDSLGYVAILPVQDPIISVRIDIKPGDSKNTINLGASGVIPVAILSTSDFNAPVQVNPDTLTLAGAKVRVAGKSGKYQCILQDVNGDSLVDLVCHFENELNAQVGDSMVVLEGETFSGVGIRGQDSIRIVP